jgi:cyclic pyranopterin phosphate synthase
MWQRFQIADSEKNMTIADNNNTLTDRFGRRISYLRLSVTDQCNLHCLYCRRKESQTGPAEDILSYDELARIARCAATLGITKIRITGGEPLMRENLNMFIAHLAAVSAIEEVSLTTNGMLLPACAEKLHKAGLKRVNISLDSLDPATYHAINGGNLDHALDGVDTACTVFTSTRVNMVVLRGINDTELPDMVSFGGKKSISVRFLELMPTRNINCKDRFMPAVEMQSRLKKIFTMTPVPSAGPGSTADWYRVEETGGEIGFISPVSANFCDECSRLRLTCRGILIPCLHGVERIAVTDVLRNGGSDEDIRECFRAAASMKQEFHGLDTDSTFCDMHAIGG